MGDDERNMAFSLEGDYEGGQWIDGEFYAERERVGRQLTRDDQIYGVFGEDEDSYRFRGKKSKRNAEPLSATPMNFVSSGSMGGEDEKEAKEEKKEPKIKEDVEEEKKSFVSRRKKERPEEKKRKATRAMMDGEFGKFEKHTKGFGRKMLDKMGFTGRLGRKESGMVNPILPQLRRGNVGLGFGRRPVQEEDEPQNITEMTKGGEKEKKTFIGSDNWKKDKVKVQKVYKTAAEIAGEKQMKGASQVVIDMRGPHARVTSLDKINSIDDNETSASSGSTLPELQHNVNLLVDLAESEISKIEREMQHTKNTIITLEHERDKLQAVVSKEAGTIERLGEITILIDRCQDQLKKMTKEGASVEKKLETVSDVFDQMQHKFAQEYRSFDLPSLAVVISFPLFKALLHNWEPLTAPSSQSPVVKILERWRMLLQVEEKDSGQNMYRKLLTEIILPKLRAILSQWHAREFEHLVPFIQQ